MKTIEFKDIAIRFDSKTILKDFNLIINKGDKVLLKGKSGSGKSSLFQILLGFKNQVQGSILIDGEEVTDKDFKHIRNQFAYVNQDITLRNQKVRDLIEAIAHFSYNELEEWNQELADQFDFDESLLDKYTKDLSGGERQRLGLLIAIQLKRPIYLLDEVTSGLNKELKKKVVDYFFHVEETVFVISHDDDWDQYDWKKVTL